MYLSKVTKYLYFVTFHHCPFIQKAHHVLIYVKLAGHIFKMKALY